MDLRGLFFLALMTVSVGVFVCGPVLAVQTGAVLSWVGASLSALVPLGFLSVLMTKRLARTSSSMPLLTALAALGPLISFVGVVSGEPGGLAVVSAVLVGWIGWPLYVFWYSKLALPEQAPFVVGAPLPSFSLFNTEGEVVRSEQFAAGHTLWMFFRGNWCPLCMAQIQEIVGAYQELQRRGVKVVLVSGQTDEETKNLARRMKVAFVFLVDHELKVAKSLGLLHENAAPPGTSLLLEATRRDSWLPTVVINDPLGTVRYVNQTDNYRVRPDPRELLTVIEGLCPDLAT